MKQISTNNIIDVIEFDLEKHITGEYIEMICKAMDREEIQKKWDKRKMKKNLEEILNVHF